MNSSFQMYCFQEYRIDDGDVPPYIVELPNDQDEVPVETPPTPPDNELTREPEAIEVRTYF